MKTKQIEKYFALLLGIRFENEHGGRYAFMQYLAYSRELVNLLKPLRNTERQIEMLEGINWLLNEYVGVKFTPRHKALFDEKIMETRMLQEEIGSILQESKRFIRSRQQVLHHAQAA